VRAVAVVQILVAEPQAAHRGSPLNHEAVPGPAGRRTRHG
jgi:hypothetical protein